MSGGYGSTEGPGEALIDDNTELDDNTEYSSREARVAALKRRENEIKMKEAELRTREEMYNCLLCFLLLFSLRLARGIGFGKNLISHIKSLSK